MECMTEKRNLTDEEREDAKRLDALLNRAKAVDKSYTREYIGELCGWSSSGMVSQYARGHTPLNMASAGLLARALAKVIPGITVADISPRFALLLDTSRKEDDPFSGETGVIAAYRKLTPERKALVEHRLKELLIIQTAEELGGKGLLG